MKKTLKVYRLSEYNTETGEIFPLFINKKQPLPLHKWIPAESHPTKGFAERPGFHCGEVPSAYWLMSADGTYKSRRGKKFKRVWTECEIPEGGFYLFKENGLNRVWLIAQKIKINKIISEEERQKILKENHFDEAASAEKYLQRFKNRKEGARV